MKVDTKTEATVKIAIDKERLNRLVGVAVAARDESGRWEDNRTTSKTREALRALQPSDIEGEYQSLTGPEGGLVGLSLSFCIQDILAGMVDESDVIRIETGTCAETEHDWEQLIHRYQASYWRRDADEAKAIVQRLRAAGKIEQPRLQDREAINIARGHWLDFTGRVIHPGR